MNIRALVIATSLAACSSPEADPDAAATVRDARAPAPPADASAPDAEPPRSLPAFCDALPPAPAAGQWQSSRVYYDGDGRLAYAADDAGNRIPDFSYAGYRHGAVELPAVAVVATLSPIDGDNTANIQAALDAAGEAGGGAVLLAPGRYPIHGTLRVRHSGVVLRGAGDDADEATSTILVGVGDTPHQRTLVIVGTGDGAPWDAGDPVDVTTPLVQVGALALDVDGGSAFAPGQEVVVRHPSSAAWIAAVDGGGVVSDDPWAPGSKDIEWVRRVVAVDGDTLTLDAPIYNHLDRALTQSTVAPVTGRNLIAEAGVESLRVDIETAGGEDEDHVWDAIGVVGAEDSWVRDVTVLHFGHAGVFTRGAIRITVRDTRALDPVAIRTGGRMYNFDAESRSQLILFTHCEATGGRHNFISNGVQTTSGVVFHRSTGTGNDDSEGHRHFSQALLFDNIRDLGSAGEIRLINRGDYGTSHGWASAHSVIWSYNSQMTVQQPPTAQNYAISEAGTLRATGYFPGAQGFAELTEGELVPASLYEAQLCDRLRP